jgi:hypothetical protein
MSLGSH